MVVKRAARLFMLMLLVLALTLSIAPIARAQRTWTVIAGGATKGWAIQAQGFFPRTIDVAVGDTVRWQFEEYHTVTFLSGQQQPRNFVLEGGVRYVNPQVFYSFGGKTYDGTGYRNSGTPPPPKVVPGEGDALIGYYLGETLRSTYAKHRYMLTFTKPGTYQYVCLLHSGMVGTVVVKQRISGSPEAALARGREEQAAVLKVGLAAWNRQKVEHRGNAVIVSMVGDTKAGYSIYRFARQPIVITRGSTVTWKMADRIEIHTVTFLGGEKEPGIFVLQPQKQGPPKIRFYPKVEERTQTQTYEGKGYANSGILFAPGAGPPNAPSEFSLTFAKPGRYEYLCMIHGPEQMRGTIIVK